MSTQREHQLREKLEGELGVATWKGLIPEMLTKSLYYVSPDIDLVEVGVQVALDHTSEVRNGWRPEPLQDLPLIRLQHGRPLAPSSSSSSWNPMSSSRNIRSKDD